MLGICSIVTIPYLAALHGPEGHVSKEGQYDYALIKAAEAPEGSDMDDSNLCPKHQ